MGKLRDLFLESIAFPDAEHRWRGTRMGVKWRYLTNTGIEKFGGNTSNNGTVMSLLCIYPHITHLALMDNLNLTEILTGTFDLRCPQSSSRLNFIEIHNSPKLTLVQPGTFGHLPRLTDLFITNVGLTQVPRWTYTGNVRLGGNPLTVLNMCANKLKRIHTGAFRNITNEIIKLSLVRNPITTIEDYAFRGLQVGNIVLRHIPTLTTLAGRAFEGVKGLHKLDLSYTGIHQLPVSGLNHLAELILEEVPSLKVIPWTRGLPVLTEARLTYPFHCCAFDNPGLVQDAVKCTDHAVATARATEPPLYSALDPLYTQTYTVPRGQKEAMIRMRRDISGHFNDSGWLDSIVPQNNDTHRTFDCKSSEYYLARSRQPIQCTPAPNALNPCEDLMGVQWLRVVVWVVAIITLLGNLTVLVVSLGSRNKMTVTKFLMCNLSIADFCIGVYLTLLAIADLKTRGVYFNYAIRWQNEGGCQVAGFLATLSTCLGIFTLAVITVERWYAISYAIYLTKRLRMRQAQILMGIAWTYSFIMGVMPLVGISGYGASSICLPMKAKTMLDKTYLVVLLFLSALAFVVICGCYIHMFRRVRGDNQCSNSSSRNDANIAKRMAILVFTDFACLFPMAFFGLTAVLGYPLITISDSKILLVFFFPLNSCANPFLYAVFTNQFKRDLRNILGRCGFYNEQHVHYQRHIVAHPYSLTQYRNSSARRLSASTSSTFSVKSLDFNRSSRGLGRTTSNNTDSSFRAHARYLRDTNKKAKPPDYITASIRPERKSDPKPECQHRLSTVLEVMTCKDGNVLSKLPNGLRSQRRSEPIISQTPSWFHDDTVSDPCAVSHELAQLSTDFTQSYLPFTAPVCADHMTRQQQSDDDRASHTTTGMIAQHCASGACHVDSSDSIISGDSDAQRGWYTTGSVSPTSKNSVSIPLECIANNSESPCSCSKCKSVEFGAPVSHGSGNPRDSLRSRRGQSVECQEVQAPASLCAACAALAQAQTWTSVSGRSVSLIDQPIVFDSCNDRMRTSKSNIEWYRSEGVSEDGPQMNNRSLSCGQVSGDTSDWTSLSHMLAALNPNSKDHTPNPSRHGVSGAMSGSLTDDVFQPTDKQILIAVCSSDSNSGLNASSDQRQAGLPSDEPSLSDVCPIVNSPKSEPPELYINSGDGGHLNTPERDALIAPPALKSSIYESNSEDQMRLSSADDICKRAYIDKNNWNSNENENIYNMCEETSNPEERGQEDEIPDVGHCHAIDCIIISENVQNIDSEGDDEDDEDDEDDDDGVEDVNASLLTGHVSTEGEEDGDVNEDDDDAEEESPDECEKTLHALTLLMNVTS